jgi:SAM-dependent methyltransferase
MTTNSGPEVVERLLLLFRELGIERAHIAARDIPDWRGLVAVAPDRVRSLSLLCPMALDASSTTPLGDRVLVITGDRGVAADALARALGPGGMIDCVRLSEYESLMWSDVAEDRGDEIKTALFDFLERIDSRDPAPVVSLPMSEGELAGISYKIRGSGPALVLMPLLLSSSQWEPIIPALSDHYCTIELGGAYLGSIAILEARGRSVFLGMIRAVVDIAGIKPGEVVLDVGCGSGVVIRDIARRTGSLNRLIGVDMSPYMLREARQLARREGLEDIEFHEGRAEALPLPDASVDVAIACTVLEEGDADRMMAEMLRVTKPGGRIAVIVRAIDVPPWVNLPLSTATKAKVEVPGRFGAGVVRGGCADASLYSRFSAAGLTRCSFFPQLTALAPNDPREPWFHQQAVATLAGTEAAEWHTAVTQARSQGTSFIAIPNHCAVGTRP